MKPALYAGLALGLVPIQVTVLNGLSLWGVRPDLCLVAACLVGIVAGRLEGLLIGLALGLGQDLFSAGPPMLNMGTKALAGLLGGLVGRHVTDVTPVTVMLALAGFSALSGAVAMASVKTGIGLMDRLDMVRFVLLPEALFNTVVGGGLYWLLSVTGRRHQQAPRAPVGLVG
ncbi:MAG: hypothetical protein AB1411_03160 [Nitrospirota bacterium]